MEEKERIIAVLVVVVIFTIIDRFLIHPHEGQTDFAFFGSIFSLVLYLAIIFFFGKKHLN